MGEKKFDKSITLAPDWRTAGRPLSAAEVSLATGWSYGFVLQHRREGTLRPTINRRPFKFDPAHVAEVLLSTPQPSSSNETSVSKAAVRSLKTEAVSRSVPRRKATKEDLWD